MTNSRDSGASTRTHLTIWAIQILAGVIVLYLLSPGPVWAILYRIDKDRERDDAWLQNLYRPISLANEHSPTFRKCMAGYLSLWVPPRSD